jgi:hypothetical protein
MPYAAFYTPETRRIVGERFHVDVDLFGYEFEVLPSV